LAFALRFRRNQRPEDIRQQVITALHSPSRYRVLGALMHMPEFYQAFGCKPTAKMVRAEADRSRIWQALPPLDTLKSPPPAAGSGLFVGAGVSAES